MPTKDSETAPGRCRRRRPGRPILLCLAPTQRRGGRQLWGRRRGGWRGHPLGARHASPAWNSARKSAVSATKAAATRGKDAVLAAQAGESRGKGGALTDGRKVVCGEPGLEHLVRPLRAGHQRGAPSLALRTEPAELPAIQPCTQWSAVHRRGRARVMTVLSGEHTCSDDGQTRVCGERRCVCVCCVGESRSRR